MAVTSDLPNKLRWTWNQFTFVVATEGPRVALERALGLSGLVEPYVEPEETLVGPPRARLSPAAAARWPASLAVFGPAGSDPATQRVHSMAAELGIPALSAGRDPGAAELASALIVVGIQNWPPPSMLVEAARLRQAVILFVAADDLDKPGLAQALRRSQAVAVDSDATALALRTRHRGLAEVRVIGRDASAEELNQLILDLDLADPR